MPRRLAKAQSKFESLFPRQYLALHFKQHRRHTTQRHERVRRLKANLLLTTPASIQHGRCCWQSRSMRGVADQAIHRIPRLS